MRERKDERKREREERHECMHVCVNTRVCVCVTSRGSLPGGVSPLVGSRRMNKPREPTGGRHLSLSLSVCDCVLV